MSCALYDSTSLGHGVTTVPAGSAVLCSLAISASSFQREDLPRTCASHYIMLHTTAIEPLGACKCSREKVVTLVMVQLLFGQQESALVTKRGRAQEAWIKP